MPPLRVVTPAADPLAYPGRAPSRSWLLDGDRVDWLAPDARLVGEWGDRHPVLAIGSNRRPGRLAAHLAGVRRTPVAGLRVVLSGADVVYPAHVATYGVCTATVVPVAGARIRAWLLLLSPVQLQALARGETLGREFDLYRLAGTVVDGPQLPAPLTSPLAFVHTNGPLPFRDGRPRRLWRVPAISSPLARASLTAAHRRADTLLGAPQRWPMPARRVAAADRRLAGHGLSRGWPLADRVNDGPRLDLPAAAAPLQSPR